MHHLTYPYQKFELASGSTYVQLNSPVDMLAIKCLEYLSTMSDQFYIFADTTENKKIRPF